MATTLAHTVAGLVVLAIADMRSTASRDIASR
jgi:hypothetical protein